MNAPFEMDRRALLGKILLLAGAASIPAGCSLSDNANGSNFKFETKQFATVSALADTLVPKGDTVGALDAKVPEKFEELMRNWASAERRTEILAAIKRLDSAAAKSGGRDFAALNPQARIEVVKAYQVEALKPDLEKATGKGGVAMMMGPPATDEGYAKMRELIIKLFYYSEPALTQELSYEHDPNGYDPSVPVTPDMRPSGGLSPI